jgi:hypothetical protein
MAYLTDYQQLHAGNLHFERDDEVLELHAEGDGDAYLKLDADDIDWLIDILHDWKEVLEASDA